MQKEFSIVDKVLPELPISSNQGLVHKSVEKAKVQSGGRSFKKLASDTFSKIQEIFSKIQENIDNVRLGYTVKASGKFIGISKETVTKLAPKLARVLLLVLSQFNKKLPTEKGSSETKPTLSNKMIEAKPADLINPEKEIRGREELEFEECVSNTIIVLEERLKTQENRLATSQKDKNTAGMQTAEMDIEKTKSSLALLKNPVELKTFIKTNKKLYEKNLIEIKEIAEGGIKANEDWTTKLQKQMVTVYEKFEDPELQRLSKESGKKMNEIHEMSKKTNRNVENILVVMLKREVPESFQCSLQNGIHGLVSLSNMAKLETKQFVKHLHDNLPSYLGLEKNALHANSSGEVSTKHNINNVAAFERFCIQKGLNTEDAKTRAEILAKKYIELLDAKRDFERDGGSKYMNRALDLKVFIEKLS